MKGSGIVVLLTFFAISFQGSSAFSANLSTTNTTNISALRQEEEIGNEVAGNALQGVAVLLATFFQAVEDIAKLKPLEALSNATKIAFPASTTTPPPSSTNFTLPKKPEVVNKITTVKPLLPLSQKSPTVVIKAPAVSEPPKIPPPDTGLKPVDIPAPPIVEGTDYGDYRV